MTVDISKYEINKPFAIRYFEGAGGKSVNRSISMIASITGVPCIVVAYWLGDHAGWPQDAIDAVIRLKDFYNYSEILNKPENSPI